MPAWRILTFLPLLALSACASAPFQVHPTHTINLNGELLPYDPSKPAEAGSAIAAGARVYDSGDHSLSPSEYDAYLERMMKAICDSGKRTVRICIHGGMNSEEDALRNADERLADSGGIGKDAYPVFINWQSSFGPSYSEHLFSLRRGIRYGPVLGIASSPFIFIADILGGLARMHLVWGRMIQNNFREWNDHSVQDELARFKAIPPGDEAHIDFQGGQDTYDLGDHVVQELDWVFVPTKMFFAPFIDSMGKEAWDVMLRRTQLAFQTERESGWDSFAGQKTDKADDYGGGNGALTAFARKLEQLQKDCQLDIEIYAHSMGTIICNRLLSRFPDLHASKITYMAAACSVRDYQDSVWPYMEDANNETTEFYNWMLHPESELKEREAFGIIPNGSLLVWIDDYYNTPKDRFDRTCGRATNFSYALDHTPHPLRPRIHVKYFDAMAKSKAKLDDPQWHSDFWKLRFWE